MESNNNNVTYNIELVQKYSIADSYSAKYVNEKQSKHSLLTGYFDDAVIYSLYVRDGNRMILVGVFKNLREANQQSKDIIKNYYELKNHPVSKKVNHENFHLCSN
ncbi:hypothetical protein [Xenorhabdus littoralis]|uniref:hypothetical protein n=1 Tax=Xenorhabdus littoralis TaxID=2582835 RepID=UPI0029E7DFF4|nr:hypothetical protein [Xenorhabdus sp. psl]MDX7993164.1 hypothetical protein [Xenorhabdus sp. psl]